MGYKMAIYNYSRRQAISFTLALSNKLLFTPLQAFTFPGHAMHNIKKNAMLTHNKQPFLLDRHHMTSSTTTSNEKDEVIPRTMYEKVLDNPKYPEEWPFSDDDLHVKMNLMIRFFMKVHFWFIILMIMLLQL